MITNEEGTVVQAFGRANAPENTVPPNFIPAPSGRPLHGGPFRDRLRKTLLVWLAVYPAVLLVVSLLGDIVKDWPLHLRVFAATILVVPIVTNITQPLVNTIHSRTFDRQGR